MNLNRLLSHCALGLIALSVANVPAHALKHLVGAVSGQHVPAATAKSTPQQLFGVWTGRLGNKRIVACWDNDGGNYYVLQNPLTIRLNYDQEAGVWLENGGDEVTITWQFHQPVKGHLAGTRSSSDKDQKLPVRLTRVPIAKTGKDYPGDCDYSGALYNAFSAPRVSAVQIRPGNVANFMGNSYRVMTAFGGSVASVELLGEEESVAKANAYFRKELLHDIRAYLSCQVFDVPQRGDFHSKVRLRFWNNEWLSWSGHSEGYCGGAHPFFDSSTNTMDLRTGKEINLWNWFKLVKKRDDGRGQVCEFLEKRCLSASLAKLVKKTGPRYEDKSCKGLDFHDMVDGGYSMGLNEKGIAIVPALAEPARAVRTCYANYTIAFANLAPYLNESGLAAVSKILAGLPGDTE